MTKYSFIIVLFFNLFTFIFTETCTKDDLTYAFTECDKTGNRWLVRVPKIDNKCTFSNNQTGALKRARNCGNPCSPGTYLETESQICKECPAGTYSQGDLVEYNYWQGPKLPEGFFTRAESNDNNEKCDNEKWKAYGDYISTTLSNCESSLYFGASLHKPGQLSFQYQMPDDEIIFQIKIRNDDCALKSSSSSQREQEKEGIYNSHVLDHTAPNKWNNFSSELSKGHNSIRIITTNMGSKSQTSSVKIRHFRVTNSVFSTECTKCPAGTFSTQKSSKCQLCPRDKYNEKDGSTECKTCQKDEFSEPGSSKCQKRLPCTKNDYTYNYTECSKDNKRQKHYHWIEPRLCSFDIQAAEQLPKDPALENCLSCPLGTQVDPKDPKTCIPCSKGTSTDDATGKCKKCPINTRPVTEIRYTKWTHNLPNLSFQCSKRDKKCHDDSSWILDGDKLKSEPSTDTNILFLNFEPIVSKDRLAMTEFSFDFSMECEGPCFMHLFLSQDKRPTNLINKWINSTERMHYTFQIYDKVPGRLVWFFHRYNDNLKHKNSDSVSIYSMNLTRIQNAGATHCQYCEEHSTTDNCLDCSDGKFYSRDQKKCINCPNGKVLKNYPGQSINDCISCGHGLIGLNNILCVPNYKFVTKNNNSYDLSILNKPMLVEVGKQFTSMGHEYHHVFNMTLVINSFDQLAQCKNNHTKYGDAFTEDYVPICRITIIKDGSKNNTYFSVQTLTIGEEFIEMKNSNESQEFWKNMNDTLDKHGFTRDKYGTDLFVKLKRSKKTDVCRKGRETVIVLRCDTNSDNDAQKSASQLLLPPKCLSGTCDGCNFMIMIKSRSLCPFCRQDDLNVITEQCDARGYQRVHYQTAKYCIPDKSFQITRIIPCPLFTLKTAIITGATLVLVIALSCTVCYCYKKNKRLEYKYMRLISSNEHGGEQVLAGAESCGMNDGDEDDEDDVKIKANSRTGNIFAKFNRQPRRKGKYEDTEQLKLDDSAEFDL